MPLSAGALRAFVIATLAVVTCEAIGFKLAANPQSGELVVYSSLVDGVEPITEVSRSKFNYTHGGAHGSGSTAQAGTFVLEQTRLSFEEAYQETTPIALTPSPLHDLLFDTPAQNSSDPALLLFVSRNHDTITRITPAGSPPIYYVEYYSYAPYITYLFPNQLKTALHQCTPCLGIGSPDSVDMTCRVVGSADDPAVFKPMVIEQAFENGNSLASLTLYMDSALPQFAQDAYQTIAFHRLASWHRMEDITQEVEESNDRRTHGARVTTAFLFLFVALGMLLWSLVAALLLAWLEPFPVPQKLAHHFPDTEGRVKFNTIVLSVVLTILNFSISAGGGFTGWLVMGVLYFLIMLGILIFMCVRKVRSRPIGSVAPDVEKPTTDSNTVTARPAGSDKEDKDSFGPEAGPPHPTAADNSSSLGPDGRWRSLRKQPTPSLGEAQVRLVIGYSVSMVLLLVVLLIIVYFWEVEEYQIYDRHEQTAVVEAIPSLTAKAVQFMYAWRGLATNLKLHLYTKWLTQWCGRKYRESLSPSEKDSAIRDAFIVEYSIDMSEYSPSDYREYPSVNTWFIRGLAEHSRPIAGDRIVLTGATVPEGHRRIVGSPADCRMLIFPTIADSKVWIKGSSFSFAELLDYNSNWPSVFANGAMVIARLAPQDYHRFNTPITGEIVQIYDVSGTYWSVNADAAKSKNYAFYNLRRVVILSYTEPSTGASRYVAYVAIGATCVGSVEFTVAVGDTVQRGDELGFMQFGGSTVIMLFEQGQFIPDADLLHNSAKPVESYIKVNERVGSFPEV
ncbi:Phosphatidylserine decarboxylase proenzyme 2 [Diplonema papillatum]|nr:Phosphatidylserine decarboxylase proenzyme 2 [Diplonema papillatum]